MPVFPRVFYVSSDYVSHRRAGVGYQDLLEGLGCRTTKLDEADMVIIHAEADVIPRLMRQIPALTSRYCVAFTVWETDRLPSAFLPGLDAMDEIWTASSYSAAALWRSGYAAWWLPHVTSAPVEISSASKKRVGDWLGPSENDKATFDILHVTKPDDPRKDQPAVEQAFASFRRQCPEARLIIKTGCFDRPPTVRQRPGIIEIVQDISDEDMAALRERCQVVVSSHRSEGWGLTMSEAMAEGMLAIAPAFSGNMTFMSHANSLLVPSCEVRVGLSAHHFEPDMLWGQVAVGALADKMALAYQLFVAADTGRFRQQAWLDMRRFSHRKVGLLMRAYLQRIATTLANGWQPPARSSLLNFKYVSGKEL